MFIPLLLEAAAVHDTAIKVRVRHILASVKEVAEVGMFSLKLDCTGWPREEIATELRLRGFGVQIEEVEKHVSFSMMIVWSVRPDDNEIEYKKRKRMEKKLQVAAKFKKSKEDK